MSTAKTFPEKKLSEIKEAAVHLRNLNSENKNRVLSTLVRLLRDNREALFKANQKDLKRLSKTTSAAFRDRLELNDRRVDQMVQSLENIVFLRDPVGETVEDRILPNGLHARRVRAPLGVVFMIFESRPNIVVEAFSLCFKSGNALILKSGKESFFTTEILYRLIHQSLEECQITKNVFFGIPSDRREWIKPLLKQSRTIDVVVPRGGDELIQFVTENSLIPIIKNDRGMCHVYIHEDADEFMARSIVKNAKTSRPAVCNAMETLLIDSSIAPRLLPEIYKDLCEFNVEWWVCPQSAKILKGLKNVNRAKKNSFDLEYLDFKINCRVVSDLDEAIDHIALHGSKHSEAIICRSIEASQKFIREVDAAAVYWNASTRFTDGFELGLGGELGISTQKLHVRGPVGLRELTSSRWVIEGQGQIRG